MCDKNAFPLNIAFTTTYLFFLIYNYHFADYATSFCFFLNAKQNKKYIMRL